MHWQLAAGLVAGGVLATAGLWWCRPTDPERSALERAPAGTGRRLCTPLSSAWLRGVRPADYPTLGGLRRRVLATELLAAALLGLLWAELRLREPVAPEPAPPAAAASAALQPHPPEAPPGAATRAPAAAEPPPAPQPPSDDEPLAEKRTPIRLYGTAKVKPVYEGHDVRGVRIENVAPGSFWNLVGLRSGDVVIEMENDPIDTPAELIALMNALEREPRIHLRVRGADGRERYLEYAVPQE